jgi:thymidylate kinase
VLIAIEGCDGSGKTTLADALAHNIIRHEASIGTDRPVQMIHASQPKLPILEEYELAIRDYDPKGTHLILDRWHWGELVYGPIYRGKSELSPAGLWHVDKFLDAKGGVMVLMDSSAGTVRERLATRGEDFLKDEHVEEVIAAFDEVFKFSVMTEKHKRGYTPIDEFVISLTLLGYIREDGARQLGNFGTYVGPRWPRFLLLGEKRKDPSWPSAFVPGNSTSGKFLLESLSHDTLKNSGLANACEEDVFGLWDLLGRPRVVTLGKVAGAVVDKEEMTHVNVPHPQWVRRFHNSKQREYGQVIARGLYDEEVTDWLS